VGNAGRDRSRAYEAAKANAKMTGTDRYVTMSNGYYWISKTPPVAFFGSQEYDVVRPDGTVERKTSTLPATET
jgi:hypothetical protein